MQSKLEFLLRLQEFIEMVKANDYLRAIAYARKCLAPWGGTYTKELQRVTATLAFKSGTNCSTYKVRPSSALYKFYYYFLMG
jgi:macrophage erythroblast attacher